MSSFSVEDARLRPVRQASLGIRQLAVICARGALLTTVALVCCGLLTWVILRGIPDDHTKAPVDFAVPVDGVMVRSGRRRDARPSAEPPIDPSVRAASYARFSSNLQSEKSIADQQRECHEHALRRGHEISADLEFVDKAVSGTKRERAGLNAMLAAAEAGQIDVLHFHSLSRLSREEI